MRFSIIAIFAAVVSTTTFCAAKDTSTTTAPVKAAPDAIASVAAAAPAAINVYPQSINLTTKRDRQSLIVQAVYPNGLTRDVTAEARIAVENESLCKVTGSMVTPVADGQSTVTVSYAGFDSKLPLTVTRAADERAISFKLDIMPVFMKAGCNTGSCHGAARGKDGFRLSLFGFDPDGDYFRLTREIPGRRINLSLPGESLLIEKAVGSVPHTGGKRFTTESELCSTLIRWLDAGAPRDEGEVPTVAKLELFPPEAVMDGSGEIQKVNVLATYSDGSTRDVTSLAYFLSNNEAAAAISQKGVVTAGERGETFITARFETHTVGADFITLPKGLEYEDPEAPANNYIDELVNAKLNKLRIAPSEICSDEEFLRRAHLDIVGLLPSVPEYHEFVQSSDPNKRAAKIDELLSRREFVEMWVMKWAELLQIRTINNRVMPKNVLRYFDWLRDQMQAEVPMDQMVQELLASNGGTFDSPPTNYYQGERDTLKVAENCAQVFMGMRIQCAQCHNHPFDRWTMDDYYGFAAFFAQIGRKRAEDAREQIIYNRGSGEVKHLVDKRNVAPKFLGGAVPDVKGKDRREVLAKWLASPENPYFARNLANIVWAHFFGQGIINEVDDVRVSNPPVNAALLDELGNRFTDYKYDFRELVRDICMSRTYQLSTATNATNESDHRNFAHAELRRLRAEVLLDCISQVTSTEDKFRGLPKGARAVQIADGNTSTYFLTTFGRATRATACSCEVKMEPNLSQALHLINGSTSNSKIVQGGLIAQRLKEKVSPSEIINELYIRCFTREPKPEEVDRLLAAMEGDPNPKAVLEDIFWSLLNAREFIFNH